MELRLLEERTRLPKCLSKDLITSNLSLGPRTAIIFLVFGVQPHSSHHISALATVLQQTTPLDEGSRSTLSILITYWWLTSCSTTMLRTYTQTVALWLSILCILPSLVSSHMIDIPASKKECFFEDLHVNDKVLFPLMVCANSMRIIRPR